ncbi:hypothetical protein PAMA_015478 [Pampus argenteus]
MTGAATVFLICCLLQGSLCQNWAAFIPETVNGLSGSCVNIPCRFQIDPDFDNNLDKTCKAIWNRKRDNKNMFDSSLTGSSANILKGKLTGNLLKKDCTTIFNEMSPNLNDEYYFRLQCNNGLKWGFVTNVVSIDVQDSLSSLVVMTPSKLDEEEGTLVRLNCSAAAPCPTLPPTLTWTPTLGDIEEHVDTQSVASVMSFNASYIHNGQNISCTALYSRQTGSNFSYNISLTPYVSFSPKETSVTVDPPGSVVEGNSVTLLCKSRANPPVTQYTWYKDGKEDNEHTQSLVIDSVELSHSGNYGCKATNDLGEEMSASIHLDIEFSPKETSVTVDPPGPVVEGTSVNLTCNANANPPVTNYTWYKVNGDQVTAVCFKKQLSYKVSEVDKKFYCTVSNKHGAQNSSIALIDVQCSRTTCLWIGAAAGALGMLLMCAPLIFFLCRKTKGNVSSGDKLVDTSDFLVTNETNSSQMNAMYASKAIAEEDVTEDTLHFADLDFTKLQAKSDGKEGEIRGLASTKTLYAEIRLRSRGNDGDGEEGNGETTISDKAP